MYDFTSSKKDLTRRMQPFLPVRRLTLFDVTLLCVNLTVVPSPVIIKDNTRTCLKRQEKDIYILK